MESPDAASVPSCDAVAMSADCATGAGGVNSGERCMIQQNSSDILHLHGSVCATQTPSPTASMSASREAGWGAHEKATRYRQAEEAKRIVKPDANAAFVFKRPAQAKPQPQQQQQQQQQAAPQPAQTNTYAPLASPPAAPTPTAPPQAPSPSEQPGADEFETKYPSTSSPAATRSEAPAPSSRSSSTSQSNILCSCLVELFEMVGSNPAPKAYGPKGVTLLRLPNSAGGSDAGTVPFLFQLLVYAPVSKKAEFSVEVSGSFAFTMLPDRFATFECETTRRSWCLKFGGSDDAHAMARSFALIGEMRAAAAYAAAKIAGAHPPPRTILTQDLSVGASDTPAVAVGDQLKVKYSVYAYDVSSPFSMDSRLRIFQSKDSSKKLILGEGLLLSTAVEEALQGMRKKGVRLLIIPPNLSTIINQNAEWAVHVKPETTLLVEVSVTGVRNSLPVGTGESPAEGMMDNTPTAAAAPSAPYVNTTQQDEPEEETGVYNPTTVPAGADMRSRMAALASAQHTNGQASATVPTPHAASDLRRDSLSGRASSRSHSPLKPVVVDSSSGPTIESLLSELSLSELLPNFKREGVTFSDLLLLDADELKTLIPQMGPRRRISGKILEIQQQKAASAATKSADTPSSSHAQHHASPSATPNSSSTNHSSAFSPFAHSASAAIPPAHPHPAHVTSPHAQQSQARNRNSTGPAADAHLFSPNPSTPAAPVSGVAARYAAAAAAAGQATQQQQQQQSSYRSRTQSDISDHSDSSPTPTPSSSSPQTRPHVPIHSQAQLDTLLALEYSRGQADTVALARDKIQDMRETASAKFAEQSREIEELKAANLADREKAREAVQRLREELRQGQRASETRTQHAAAVVALYLTRTLALCVRVSPFCLFSAHAAHASLSSSYSALQSEKDSLSDKSQKYISQMKTKMAAANEGASAASVAAAVSEAKVVCVRETCEEVYAEIKAKVKPKELYEGDEVLTMLRGILKNTSTNQAGAAAAAAPRK